MIPIIVTLCVMSVSTDLKMVAHNRLATVPVYHFSAQILPTPLLWFSKEFVSSKICQLILQNEPSRQAASFAVLTRGQNGRLERNF